jgi:bifunctional non-homologous end joining protein LigD
MPKHPPALALPVIAAHPLKERREPFDGPDWLFEMKYDGYRGLLYLEHGKPRLTSRNGRTMKRFGALTWALVHLIRAETAILDGEIVTKDASGRPIFLHLMRRPNDASYVAFDLLWLDGQGLRSRSLSASERSRVSCRKTRR